MTALSTRDVARTLPAVVLFGIVVAVTARRLFRKRTEYANLPLPPGPKGVPILGVSLDMIPTSTNPPMKFMEWATECKTKDLLLVKTLNQTHISIHTVAAAKFLLEKRGGIFADRPRDVLKGEIMERSMVLANIGDPIAVKRRRTLLHGLFNKVAVEEWYGIQTEEARNMLHLFLADPKSHRESIRLAQRRAVLRLVYSDALTISYDEVWATAKKAFERPYPGITQWLYVYPWLRFWPSWLPGGDFHRIAGGYYDEDETRWMLYFRDIKSQMDHGRVPPSFLSRMIEANESQGYGFSDLEIAFAAGNLLTAGGDLPEFTVGNFLAAMLVNPAVYQKIQAEVDRVVGSHRLPEFYDQKDLPYLRAAIVETERWRSIQPLGVPHRCTEETEYRGMRIPKGAFMFPNHAAMNIDPDLYPEPDEFRPERYLDSTGKALSRKLEPPTFGFGRRMCSAVNLAENNLFINIATLAWAFDLVPPTDESGAPILPDVDWRRWMDRWERGHSLDPPEFEVSLRVRSPEHEAVIKSERRAAN